MPHEEALLVVVGVDEPAGDTLGAVTADFACRRVENINTLDVDHQSSVAFMQDFDVRLAENYEQVAFPGGLELAAHVEVRVHACLQDGNAPKLAEFARVSLIVERTGDEDVKAGVAGLARSLHEVWS